ncbi:L-seryl-tRNA(Sec) selenium transferase [Phycisphaeraceae bacterium D3-23]
MSQTADNTQAMMRSLPGVDRLAADAALDPWRERLPAGVISAAARDTIDAVRASLLKTKDASDKGNAPAPVDALYADLVQRVVARLEALAQPPLASVINATGILIHTGLGRSPLAQRAVDALADVAAHYAPVELDMPSGARGQRNDIVRELLCELTGAESAIVVNNTAAAMLHVLWVVGKGKNVVLSRGEMVEIGGSFRMPDVMAAAGVTLCEVGTTNKTRLADYANHTDDDTAGYLKVHPSNYRIQGFTATVEIEDLCRLGRERGVAVIDDIGSGAMFDYGPWGLSGEPVARRSVQAGADLVCFSGDKLLGGPQAGIIVGKKTWIDRCEKHPLMRALRVGKLTLAALGATLQLHRDPKMAAEHIPVLRALTASTDALRVRAESLAKQFGADERIAEAGVVETEAYMGGGSNPAQAVPSVAVRLRAAHLGEDELATRLRTGKTPLLPRVADGALWLDVRTVFPEQDAQLILAVLDAANA